MCMQAGEGLGRGSVLHGAWMVNWQSPLPQPLARPFTPVPSPPGEAEKHFSCSQRAACPYPPSLFQPNLPAGTGCAASLRPGQGGGGSGRNKALTVLVGSSENLQEKNTTGFSEAAGRAAWLNSEPGNTWHGHYGKLPPGARGAAEKLLLPGLHRPALHRLLWGNPPFRTIKTISCLQCAKLSAQPPPPERAQHSHRPPFKEHRGRQSRKGFATPL